MDETLPELELQQEIERFSTQFCDRVTQATESLERSSVAPEVRDEALRKNLRYVSAAMEIATGPFPEVNLLDMIVFVRLCRAVLERHWIPALYGSRGHELAEVFARSDEELSDVAAKALNEAQRREVAQLVDSWLRDNPDQHRVELIRLSGFSSMVGAAAVERAGKAKGLLASVKSATHAASQALLLSERAMFLFHRLPFVWRLQARYATREILGDAITQLSVGPQAPLVRVRHQARQLARRSLWSLALASGAGVLAWWLGSGARRRRLAS
jgi:hypothetical protein